MKLYWANALNKDAIPEKSPLKKKCLQINLNICGFSEVFILKRNKKYGQFRIIYKQSVWTFIGAGAYNDLNMLILRMCNIF